MTEDDFELRELHEGIAGGRDFIENTDLCSKLVHFMELIDPVWMPSESRLEWKKDKYTVQLALEFKDASLSHITPKNGVRFANSRNKISLGGTAATAGLAPPSAPLSLYTPQTYNYTDWKREWDSTPVEDQASKCDCGSEKTYGEGTNLHSHWCSKADKS